MAALLRLSAIIDGVSRAFAIVAASLVLLACLISAGNAVSRYLFSLSSNAWLEIQWQMFAGMFLLGAPYVLLKNEHVRVDLLYGPRSARGKLWTDVVGLTLFLAPSTLIIIWFGWRFFAASFATGEISSNAGGLPLWPVKFLLPLGFSLLLLQGASELIKRVAALQGRATLDTAYEKPLQ